MKMQHLHFQRSLTTLASLTTLTLALSATPALAQSDPHAGHGGHAMQMQQEAAKTYTTSGIVKSIQADKKRAMIEHDAIPELKWPAMNMPFDVPDAALLASLKTNERINFEFQVDAQGRSALTKVIKK